VTALDHLLAALLVLIFPPYSAWDVPRLARRVAADPLHARTKFYLWNMVTLWALTTALVAGWSWAGRPLRDLGLQPPDNAAGWWSSLLIAGAGIGLIVQQAYSFAMSPNAHAQVREKLDSQPVLRTVLPSTPREARVFHGVAVTAGVCEEVLYRGYLLWYFQSLVPAGLAIAAAISAFGLAHVYQGTRNILTTGAAGAIAMAVYLLTGSLLAPILLHAALDLVNGSTVYRVRRGSTPVAEAADSRA
jgi:membrane protease YdiL (CAAX protease family)